LCNVTLPWALRLAEQGVETAARESPALAAAANIHRGQVTNRAVAETFRLPFADPFQTSPARKGK
jgi:alanine dehydrogenase